MRKRFSSAALTRMWGSNWYCNGSPQPLLIYCLRFFLNSCWQNLTGRLEAFDEWIFAGSWRQTAIDSGRGENNRFYLERLMSTWITVFPATRQSRREGLSIPSIRFLQLDIGWFLKRFHFVFLESSWLPRKKKNYYRKQRQRAISEQIFMTFSHCQNHQN